MIAAQPRHGYELIKAIEEKFSGTYSPSPGVIYPALSMLEDMGLIAQDLSEGPRKRYAITEAGRAHLAAEQPKLDALLARLGQAASGRAGVPPQILRAMENVKLALRLRLAANAPDPAQADAIAAALDDAARAIERS
jgi:DNA-binding PadR family transcriptional regulator